jgi:superfamily I DNA/RNA helicase
LLRLLPSICRWRDVSRTRLSHSDGLEIVALQPSGDSTIALICSNTPSRELSNPTLSNILSATGFLRTQSKEKGLLSCSRSSLSQQRPRAVGISTMHLTKGLVFRAVVVMACDEAVLPDAERIGAASDPAELEDIYNSERQLLYVAGTRARDRLLIMSAGVASEFCGTLVAGKLLTIAS